MYLARNTDQAKEIPSGGLVAQGYGYGNRLMIETVFLVSSRHKQRDILKAKVSQELSLKLSLETVVKENASLLPPQTETRRGESILEDASSFLPRFCSNLHA